MDKIRKRRRIINLWLKDPCCHWCRKPTFLIIAPLGGYPGMRHAPEHPQMATLDHLHSRLSGNRKYVEGEETTVLACRKCNNERAAEEEKKLSDEERWLRSGRIPVPLRIAQITRQVQS